MKERTYQIVLDGIVITVTKKRIKNMYLRIKKEDGMVLISAPYQMSDLRIRGICGENGCVDTEISAKIQGTETAVG